MRLFIRVLSTIAGLLAWVALAWKALSDSDSVTPQSEEGGFMMVLALGGTILMILGMIVLHFVEDAVENEGGRDGD